MVRNSWVSDPWGWQRHTPVRALDLVPFGDTPVGSCMALLPMRACNCCAAELPRPDRRPGLKRAGRMPLCVGPECGTICITSAPAAAPPLASSPACIYIYVADQESGGGHAPMLALN